MHDARESSDRESPAVGISLTTTYGTVSIRRSDGSLIPICRVDGDKNYAEMMRRLSSSESTHPCPPYNNMEEMWQDVPRQLWRSARKRLGLPASPDVGRLAILLKQLYAAALVHTGSNTSVVVSYPSLFALYDEDVFDAMQYLDMRTLRDFYFYEPRQIDAAYAGHGMGLCKTYKNREKCYSQGLDLLVRDVLLIEYIQASLVLHVKRVREAQDLGWSDMDATVTFDLGSGSKHSADHASRLQWEISALLRKVYQIKPSKVFVIFTGESGGDLDLQKLVKDVIEDFGYDVELFTSTPEFIASRGAAELAWRAQFLKRSS